MLGRVRLLRFFGTLNFAKIVIFYKLREFLAKEGIKFSQIIGDLPFGERILINDTKPSGLKTAYAINKKRDKALKIEVKIDENL